MAAQKILSRPGADTIDDEAAALPPVTVRLVGAVLALAVATAHVADQGGVTAFTFPDWLGWSYRLIEAFPIGAGHRETRLPHKYYSEDRPPGSVQL